MRPAFRARLVGILPMLLLVSALGAPSAFGAATPPPQQAPTVSSLVFGAGSCVGTDACTGAVGPIGDNSCIGETACLFADGTIGSNACDGGGSCWYSEGNVGDGSCNGAGACGASTENIGVNSCNAEAACADAQAPIGNNSCNGGYACDFIFDPVGDCQNNFETVPPACLATYGADARIRKQRHGAWVGGGIVNTTATGQGRSRTTTPRYTVGFGIRIQNTGDAPDSFSVAVTDPTAPECFTFCFAYDADTPGFNVRYFAGPQQISADVNGGTFVTPELAPGEWYQFVARVRVTADATPGSQIKRLLTFTSENDGMAQDAVKFVVNAADEL